jgi:hypothetical protein
MDNRLVTVYYYSVFNSFSWICALSFFLLLFVSFFFRWTAPVIYVVPSILGMLFVILFCAAVCTTCSLPVYRTVYVEAPVAHVVHQPTMKEDEPLQA